MCVCGYSLVSRTQNTYAQYIAAKELKRLGWRYHTGYMMWFQRFREPITLTDTYEESDMIFYDYVSDVDQNTHTHTHARTYIYRERRSAHLCNAAIEVRLLFSFFSLRVFVRTHTRSYAYVLTFFMFCDCVVLVGVPDNVIFVNYMCVSPESSSHHCPRSGDDVSVMIYGCAQMGCRISLPPGRQRTSERPVLEQQATRRRARPVDGVKS